MKFSKHHLVVSGHVGGSGWAGLVGLHISCYKSLHCLRVPAGDISTRLMVNRPKERHPGNHNIMTSTQPDSVSTDIMSSNVFIISK